jgi:hypothetical protein
MKKLLFLSFGLIILTILSSGNCNKDKDKTCNRDVAGISGTHKITAVRYKATPTSTELDYYALLFPDACERDDVWVLNANGSFAFNDVGVICAPSGSYTGFWSLSANTLILDGDPFNIDDFNCSTTTLSYADYNVVGDKLIVVFTRQ